MTVVTYPVEWLARREEADRPEEPSSDLRTVFAHDVDRVIYASAFRRLAGKSQVVAATERGNFHTRLTHSLKVAQLGRRVAEKIRYATGDGENLPLPIGKSIPAPDPDLIEAACLAHDLGHPPFGHVGERTLNACIDERLAKDPSYKTHAEVVRAGGFEGNAQTFRILTYLAVRSPTLSREPSRPGLNFAKATLAATIKYPWLRHETPDPDRSGEKWGAYSSPDEDILRWAIGPLETGYLVDGSFESQMMDWCDDVTYAVHDLVDFYMAGHLPLDRLLSYRQGGKSTELSAEALTFIEEVADYRQKTKSEHRREYDRDQMTAAWRMVVDHSFIAQPWSPKYAVKSAVHLTTNALIAKFVENVGWATRGTRRMPGSPFTWREGAPLLYESDFVVDEEPDVHHQKRLAVAMLKYLFRFRVIEQPRLQSQQVGQEAIVRELFHAHFDRASKLLPSDRAEELDDHGSAARAASDHVASLTEGDAVAMFRRITGSRLGAYSDNM
jgi:dGTPase